MVGAFCQAVFIWDSRGIAGLLQESFRPGGQCQQRFRNAQYPVFNEHMFIRYHFFDDMDDELFLRAFQEMFVCPDSRSPEELACEKAFLLCRPIHGSHCPQALGLLKLEEMLADERFSKLLKEKYNFSTIECGKYTGQHIFNDLYTQKYEEKIRDRSTG